MTEQVIKSLNQIKLVNNDCLGVIHKLRSAIRGEGVLLCVTLGDKVFINGSNKRYRGGGEGVKNFLKMHYVIYEQPLI